MEVLTGWFVQAEPAPAPAAAEAPSANVSFGRQQPSAPVSNGHAASEGEVKVDVADDVVEGALRVCTLNVGGRNTNSFEFLMAGDGSELGKQWEARYKVAVKNLSACGPRDFVGLGDAVKAVLAQCGEPGAEPDPFVASLLTQPTWTAMLAEVTERHPRAINALNMASLAVGRPSPLEQPDNVKPDEELLVAGAWLQA